MVHHMMNTITPSAKNISRMSNHMLNFPHRWWPVLLIGTAILSACASPVPLKQSDCACQPAGKPIEQPAQVVDTPKKVALPLLEKTEFSALPGWQQANHDKWLTAFAEQCPTLLKRKASPAGLIEACRISSNRQAGNAQALLEKHFEVWQFQQDDGRKDGLLTGYYEPLLNGSRTRQGKYTVPLYGVPKDLITVKLDELFPELKGKRVRGRLQGNTLVPYFDRGEWENSAGPERGKAIAWVDDKLDAFLLQVQGSGRVRLPDGKVIRLSYADQNGHPYKAIGKVLIDRGELKQGEATIPAIRAWAEKNPQKLDDLLNANPSVVFFEENKVLNANQGPVGALGLPLTGGMSLAVDRGLVPYGSMLWIDSLNPITRKPLQHGVLAQDTGGAIRGRVRADYFWGTGHEAGALAGLTKENLKMWLIWPKGAPLHDAGN